MLQENEQAGVRYFTFPDLTAMGVDHVIGTRQGGVSPAPFASLNVSMSVGDAAENVRQNRARLGQIVGVTPEDMVTAWLVHGNDVAPVNGAHRGQRIPYHDALVTNEPEVPLFMTFADCVPIILFDPVHRAVGLIHAGWRGTAAGIVPRTVQVMHQCFQTRPQDLVLAFGPAIGRCHYEVGPEVLQAFQHLVRTPAVFEPADNALSAGSKTAGVRTRCWNAWSTSGPTS